MKKHVFFSVLFFFQLSQALPVCPDSRTVLSQRAQNLNGQLQKIKSNCPDLADRVNALSSQVAGVSMRHSGFGLSQMLQPNDNNSASLQMVEPAAPVSDESFCAEHAPRLIENLENQSPAPGEPTSLEEKINALYQNDPNCSTAETNPNRGNGISALTIAGGAAAVGALAMAHFSDTSRDPIIPHDETDEGEDQNHESERTPPSENSNCRDPSCPAHPPTLTRQTLTEKQVLIVTDQEVTSPAVQNIKEAFFSHPIFSCIGRERFKIEVIHESNLDCSVTRVGAQSSTIGCSNPTFELANTLRATNNAKTVLLVVGDSAPAGSFHARSFAGSNSPPGPVSVMTTSLHRQGGVHEILHAVGFSDEYSARQPPARGGTIMNNLRYGYIPRSWWPTILNYFGYEAISCGSAEAQLQMQPSNFFTLSTN